MNYVVGGTPRSGKTALKSLFLKNYQIPGFCTDYLRDALEHEAPQFGIKDGMSDAEKSERLWPYFRGILEQRRKYYIDDLLIEGANFLPKYLKEFVTYPNFRIAFLGFSEIDLEEKFKYMRNYPSESGEWTSDMSDQELMELVKYLIETSKNLKSECEVHGIKYFDTSRDFEEVINQAADYLISNDVST